MGGAASASRTITFSNTGATPLSIPAGAISITGSSAAAFHVTTGPASGAVLAPGQSLSLAVNFEATAPGPQGAILRLMSDDPSTPAASVALRGLGTLGEQGSLEPSLQWILDTY